MAPERRTRRVKLIIGVLATDEDLLSRVGQILEKQFGAIDRRGTPFPTREPAEPGIEGARRQYLSFQGLFDPGRLPEAQRLTAAIERRMAEECAALEGLGPVHLTPGYLTASKVVASSTSDDHQRIYLSSGVFAEIVLRYRDGRWEVAETASRDYQTETAGFFGVVRERYLEQLAGD